LAKEYPSLSQWYIVNFRTENRYSCNVAHDVVDKHFDTADRFKTFSCDRQFVFDKPQFLVVADVFELNAFVRVALLRWRSESRFLFVMFDGIGERTVVLFQSYRIRSRSLMYR